MYSNSAPFISNCADLIPRFNLKYEDSWQQQLYRNYSILYSFYLTKYRPESSYVDQVCDHVPHTIRNEQNWKRAQFEMSALFQGSNESNTYIFSGHP